MAFPLISLSSCFLFMDKSDIKAGAEVKCLLPSVSVGHIHGTKISTHWFLVLTLAPRVSEKGAKGALHRFLIRGSLNLSVSQKVVVTIYLQGYIVSAPLRLQVILQKKNVGNEASRATDSFCGQLKMLDLLLSNYVPGTCTFFFFF